MPNNFIYERKQGFSFPLIDILKRDKEKEKIENILTSKNSIFKKNGIKMLLTKTRNSKIRPELIFSLLNMQIWINKKFNGELNIEDEII